MFLNFGKFFGFGFQSKFDNLLKQEGLTLERILNEEDILQELRNQSSTKFADFVIQNPQEYKKMINYLIQEVPDQCIDKVQFIRYPFMISEIFAAENEQLINFLFEKPEERSQEEIQNPLEDEETVQTEVNSKSKENEELRATLLDQLLSVLDNDVIIITTAGYFGKVVQAIIHRRGNDFWEHLKHQPTILSNLFKHASQKHITDIFEKLILLDTMQEESEHLYVDDRQQLIIRLLKFLQNKQSEHITSNICEMFIEVYRKTLLTLDTQDSFKDIINVMWDPIKLMNLAIQTQNNAVYQLLVVQFEFYDKIMPANQNSTKLEQLYNDVIQLIPKALIQQNSNTVPFDTSYKEHITPLGEAKLTLITFLIQLVSRLDLYKCFKDGLIFQNVIDLVRKYPSNNQLHILFEKLIMAIGQMSILQEKLFEGTNLLVFLIENTNTKVGYAGILRRIINYLNSIYSSSETLKSALSVIQDRWDESLQSLVEINKNESEWLLGVNPRQREQQINVESLSPPIDIQEVKGPYQIYQQDLTNESSQQQEHQGIRKCVSSDANEIIKETEQNDQSNIPQQIQTDSVQVENINSSDSDKDQNDVEAITSEKIDTEPEQQPQEIYQVQEETIQSEDVQSAVHHEREIVPSPVPVQIEDAKHFTYNNEPDQEKIQKQEEKQEPDPQENQENVHISQEVIQEQQISEVVQENQQEQQNQDQSQQLDQNKEPTQQEPQDDK